MDYYYLVRLWLGLMLIFRQCSSEPLFLFSGQSNMVGHASDRQSVEKNDHLKEAIFELLGTKFAQKNITARILQAYQSAKMKNTDIEKVAGHQAELVVELWNQGLLDNIRKPHEFARCSFRDPKNSHRPQLPAAKVREKNQREKGSKRKRLREEVTSKENVGKKENKMGTKAKKRYKTKKRRRFPDQPDLTKLSPDVNCGRSFGHELLFAHTISQTFLMQTQFSIAKVASGGTEIYKDWYPGVGTYWNDLNHTIHNTPGEWYGFAWHQGENDCFTYEKRDKEDTTLTYLGNLTVFIDTVRTEIQKTNPDRFVAAKDVPVAIFELGAWPNSNYSRRVVAAQNAFVEQDENSVLIPINDLCPHYHLDPAALMISGNRLANLWAPLLDPVYKEDIYYRVRQEDREEEIHYRVRQEDREEEIHYRVRGENRQGG